MSKGTENILQIRVLVEDAFGERRQGVAGNIHKPAYNTNRVHVEDSRKQLIQIYAYKDSQSRCLDILQSHSLLLSTRGTRSSHSDSHSGRPSPLLPLSVEHIQRLCKYITMIEGQRTYSRFGFLSNSPAGSDVSSFWGFVLG